MLTLVALLLSVEQEMDKTGHGIGHYLARDR
jgi:hypothetical protein